MRFFNTCGPIRPEEHYYIPNRLDWDEILNLIERKQYFVLHAPRQSGKTTAIMELCRHLRGEKCYNALYINVEAAQAVREEVKEGMLTIVQVILEEMKNQLPNESAVIEYLEKCIANAIGFNTLNEALKYLALYSSKPMVLFIDEIDALIGDTLLSTLRQIRAGYPNRPKHFPHALCLIGLRDVRDYRIWSREEGKLVSTSSPFNIKAKSLELLNFSSEQIAALYAQHTQETGQVFSSDAVEYVYHLSRGQPWLVNALAYQTCFCDVKNHSQPITKEAVERAKDTLIKQRDTHIDSLLDKLNDKRVLPVIEAILTGETNPSRILAEDLQYVRDLGLVSKESLAIANPIYQEIIPRELTAVTAELITATAAPFTGADGALNVAALIEAFIEFYRENSAIWLKKFEYQEAGPHLLMMAFLQRVINGGGAIQREYALGSRRVDILIRWRRQKIVIELKIHYKARSLSDGLQQTAAYMDIAQTSEGHLILFNRNTKKSWQSKIYHRTEIVDDKVIHVWEC